VVAVKAAGINPSDLGNAMGKFPQTHLPRIPGRDYAGIVADGPNGWKGSEVWGSSAELGFTQDGTHAQYVSVPVNCLVRKPERLTFAQAAAAGVPYVTAWQAVSAVCLRGEERVLVIGAGGAVGSAACQLALTHAVTVFGVVRGSTRVPEGVERIDSEKEDVVERVRKLTDGHGVDICLDTVSGRFFDISLKCLANCGRLAVIIAQGDGKVTLDLRDFYRRRLQMFGVNTLDVAPAATAEIYRQLTPRFQAGSLISEPPQTIPLTQAVEAYRAMAKQSGHKMVLVP
jgi:NADPH2:quinone reductase